MSTCIAAVALARAEAGHRDTINDVPSWQWQIWWGDLRPYCPDALSPPLERRRANALNVEIGQPLQRCKVRSPDGRGLAWLLSGGSPLAYGLCERAHCPRCGGANAGR